MQFVASISDNRGVGSAEYSVDGETWLPIVQSNLNGTLWEASFATTHLPNGQVVLYVRALTTTSTTGTDSPVVLKVQNNVVPMLNIDDVDVLRDADGRWPRHPRQGATATGFPEPDITYSWFVCETLVANCTFYNTPF